jgi:hypothetical protein
LCNGDRSERDDSEKEWDKGFHWGHSTRSYSPDRRVYYTTVITTGFKILCWECTCVTSSKPDACY